MKKQSLLAVCALTACSVFGHADAWVPSGAKGLAMGGAQVAFPEGSQAVNVNPAALAKPERFDIALPITVTLGSEGSAIESLTSLEDTWKTSVEPSLDALETANGNKADQITAVSNFITKTAKNALDKPGQGIRANINGALTARWGRFGISAGTRAIAGATIKYDSSFKFSATNGGFIDDAAADDIRNDAIAAAPSSDATEIATAASTGNSSDLSANEIEYYVAQVKASNGTTSLTTDEKNLLTSLAQVTNQALDPTTTTTKGSSTKLENGTGLDIRGVQISEVSLAYGWSFMENKLHVAPSLKIMKGETYTSSITLTDSSDDNEDIGDKLDDDKNTKSSTEFTLDVGLLYQQSPKLSFGLVIKDLTSPSFDVANGNDIELETTARVGAAYEYSQKPGWRGVVAADLDLIETESAAVIGADTQIGAIGLSQELAGFLSFRAGLNKNFGGESDGVVYSAGLGFQFFKFYLDLAAAGSSDEVTVDGDDFPTGGGFGVTLGWNMNL